MAHDEILQEGEYFVYSLRVPKERVAVFIGHKGEMKKRLAQDLDATLSVESRDSEVSIRAKDSLKLYVAKDVLKAIARGFNPEIALQLLRADYTFELLDITEYANTKDGLMRLKGRVIGAEGKSWKTIETLTETNLSVYGKTVAIIGEISRANTARRAVESLLSGSQHAAVYKWLEKQRRNFTI